jgi:triphosphatase
VLTQLCKTLATQTSWCGSYPGLKANSVLVHRPEGGGSGTPMFLPDRRRASEVMCAYHARVRKLGQKIRKLDTGELHRLRIRVKKLRYATECFEGLWPSRRTKRYLSALKDLQEVLGELHDATVAEKLVAHLKMAGAGDARCATAHVDRWLLDCQRRSRKEVFELWDRFENRKLFGENT